MTLAFALLDLAGAIALLLWGTHMVQTGIQRAFGARLRAILGSALRNRLFAFLAGMGVTAALQSSTATALMTAGFAAAGFVDLVPALAVMLGANVGTTLIVQVLSFDVAAVSPALILGGYVMFRRDTSSQVHDLGRVMIGLGLMLLALHQLLALTTHYEDLPLVRRALAAISNQPLLDVIVAAGLTWAAHSSVAVVLAVASLASKGLLPLDAAMALVLGANIGTAINPVMEGPARDDPAARRLPLGNLLTRAVGVLTGLALLKPAAHFLAWVEPDTPRAIADFHTIFNVALAAIVFPLLGPYARLLRKILPRRIDPTDPSQPLYLDAAARETPIVALGGAAREALRLVDVLTFMLEGARDALVRDDRRLIASLKRRDDVLDRLNTAIKTYLTSLDPDELNEAERVRLDEILIFAMHLEQAGDVVDRNLLPHALKRVKRGLAFSKEGELELTTMMERLISNLRTAATVFMTADPRVARALADEKVVFRQSETAATRAHFDRLRSGNPDTSQTSPLHLDMLRDMKLVNSHIVAAAAYPVLARSGELLASRRTVPE